LFSRRPFRKIEVSVMARILEKQNLLQMSQVLFRCPRINHQVVLFFKDSKSEAAELSVATPSAL